MKAVLYPLAARSVGRISRATWLVFDLPLLFGRGVIRRMWFTLTILYLHPKLHRNCRYLPFQIIDPKIIQVQDGCADQQARKMAKGRVTGGKNKCPTIPKTLARP